MQVQEIKTYEDLKQQKMRDSNILEDMKKSNQKGIRSNYSEEQILKAQEQQAKKEINLLYEEKINPSTNGIIYFIYYIFTLIALPVLFYNESKYKGIVAIGAWLLLFIVVVVNKRVEKKYQKEMHKDIRCAKYFNKFSNDTCVLNYLLSSLGYMLAFFDVFSFLFIYAAMVFVFFVALLFDIIKPFWVQLRWKKTYDNDDE